MLTVTEVARRIRRDPETVRRWIRSGRLRARKVGSQHVIDEGDPTTLSGRRGKPVEFDVTAPSVDARRRRGGACPALLNPGFAAERDQAARTRGRSQA